ncbi:hypothetical protein [Desulfovulcanus sp.]
MKLIKISIFCLILFFTACAPKKIITPPEPKTAALIHRADQAWKDKNYRLSQKLYAQILLAPDLNKKNRITAWKRLAFSAIHNKDYAQALTALEHWAKLTPQVKNTWSWQKLYIQALKQTQSDAAYEEYLCRLIINNKYPFSLRLEAGYVLAKHYFAQKKYSQALQVYKELHEQARDNESKITLETHLANFLEQFSLPELQAIKSNLDQAKKWDFPQNIVFWVYSIQKLKTDNSCWPRIWPNLNTLIQNGRFTDVKPFLAEFDFWEKKLGKPAQTIGLILPLSGPYSAIGWKILRGAGLAQWSLLQDGVQIKIKTINTDSPDWQNIVCNENETVIFGGPILKKNWEKLTSLGENKRKFFFTFLPTIDQEGQAGWRFFPSPRDQVRVLVKKVIQDLNCTNLAILYPEEDFGRKMSRIFWEESTKLGGKITGLKSYPPDQPTKWGKVVASFLNIKDKDDPLQNPDPDFQAVFIPDSLSRASAIIPQFFFYDENRLIFLGPMLWTQGFNPKELEVHYFSLALVPGAWWPENQGAKVTLLKKLLDQTAQGKPDFWVALGFDFVRFSAMLGTLSGSWHSSKLNHILAQIKDAVAFDWTMAPISWDEHGQASQDLFVFQPSSSGLIPANMTSIEAKIEFRTKRRAQKLEKLMLEQNSTLEAPDTDQLVQQPAVERDERDAPCETTE